MTVQNDEDVKSDLNNDDDVPTQAEPDEAGSAAEPTTEAAEAGPGPVRQALLAVARFWVAILLVLALAVTGGVTAWLYVNQYRPDQQTNAAAAEAAVKAASDGTVALLSYSPESLDADFATARTLLTGDFLNYYNQFTEQIVAPAAKKNAVKTQAAVVNAAVSELHSDRAVVLVFLNQTTTSTENPDGSFSTSSVKVGLTKVNDAWLISSFDPV